MSANITALASLVIAIATLVTAIGGAWIGIASNMNLRKHVKEVRSNNDSMNSDINQVKSDMFALTSVMTQSVAPMKKP